MTNANGFDLATETSRRTVARLIAAIALGALALAGCTSPMTQPMPDGGMDVMQPPPTETVIAAIVNGREARNRPSACTISAPDADGNYYVCSATLVAPNVVLTAAHCVEGYTAWEVMCPYAADRSRVHATDATMAPSYPGGDTLIARYTAGTEDPGSDLALVRLDRPLSETHVARVAFTAPVVSEAIFAYGRMRNGRFTNQIYASPIKRLTDIDTNWGRWAGLRIHLTDPGDSGGGIVDDETGNIIGVVSSGRGQCVSGTVCDRFAMLHPEQSWFLTTLAHYVNTMFVLTQPMGCASAISCADCTSRMSCGWCNGACVNGTVDGGGSCTRAAGTWDWTQDQCPVSSGGVEMTYGTTVDVSCESATSCAACTPMAGCGWCNGACISGDENGGGSCTATAGDWTWLSSDCSDAPPPPTDPCAAAADCAACTAMANCGWCNGACVSGTSDGGSTCTATAGDWAWLSSECPDATPTDSCSTATDCAACTGLAGCGWCNGACQAGDYSGPTGATCDAWAWYSFQCP